MVGKRTFVCTKSIVPTRPIIHSCDSTLCRRQQAEVRGRPVTQEPTPAWARASAEPRSCRRSSTRPGLWRPRNSRHQSLASRVGSHGSLSSGDCRAQWIGCALLRHTAQRHGCLDSYSIVDRILNRSSATNQALHLWISPAGRRRRSADRRRDRSLGHPGDSGVGDPTVRAPTHRPHPLGDNRRRCRSAWERVCGSISDQGGTGDRIRGSRHRWPTRPHGRFDLFGSRGGRNRSIIRRCMARPSGWACCRRRDSLAPCSLGSSHVSPDARRNRARDRRPGGLDHSRGRRRP